MIDTEGRKYKIYDFCQIQSKTISMTSAKDKESRKGRGILEIGDKIIGIYMLTNFLVNTKSKTLERTKIKAIG